MHRFPNGLAVPLGALRIGKNKENIIISENYCLVLSPPTKMKILSVLAIIS